MIWDFYKRLGEVLVTQFIPTDNGNSVELV